MWGGGPGPGYPSERVVVLAVPDRLCQPSPIRWFMGFHSSSVSFVRGLACIARESDGVPRTFTVCSLRAWRGIHGSTVNNRGDARLVRESRGPSAVWVMVGLQGGWSPSSDKR